jgi:hypothetical protein
MGRFFSPGLSNIRTPNNHRLSPCHSAALAFGGVSRLLLFAAKKTKQACGVRQISDWFESRTVSPMLGALCF